MSGEAKFGEPWTFDDDRGATDRDGNDLDGGDPAIQKRVLECVNALAGIPSPAAIPAVIEAAREAAKAIEVATELGAAQSHGLTVMHGILLKALAELEGK